MGEESPEARVRIKGKDYFFPDYLPGKGHVIAVSEFPNDPEKVLLFTLYPSGKRAEDLYVYEAEKKRDRIVPVRKVGSLWAMADKGEYHIVHFRVKEEYRGKGIGETLVSIARRRAMERKARVIEFPRHPDYEGFYSRQNLPVDSKIRRRRQEPEKVAPRTRLKFYWAGLRKRRRKR